MQRKYKIILGVIAAFIILSFIKNAIVQAAIEGGISKFLPVSVRIGSTDASFIQTRIQLKGLKVMNPAGIPDRVMADIPLVYIDFDPSGLSKHEAHFQEVRLSLKELIVIKDKNGNLNVNALKPGANKSAAGQKEAAKPAPAGQKTSLLIDKMYLSIDKVVYKDYSQGSPPFTQTFDIGIKDREFTHITNPASIASIIMVEAIAKTTLGRIANLDVSLFKDQAEGIFSGAMNLGGGGTQKVEETAKKLFSLFN